MTKEEIQQEAEKRYPDFRYDGVISPVSRSISEQAVLSKRYCFIKGAGWAREEEKRKAAQRMKDVSEMVEMAMKAIGEGRYWLANRELDDANTLLKLPI